MLRLSSFILYLLSFCVAFLLGVSYAGWTEAAKGQMLAGGAIVLGYGVIGSIIGLILSIIIARQFGKKRIIQINIGLSVLLAALIFYFKIKYDRRQAERETIGQLDNEYDSHRHTSSSVYTLDPFI